MSESLFATLTEAALGHQGLRRTALFLHGLHPVDRDLLMREVDVDHRQSLFGLLEELDTLGIHATDAQEGMAALSEPATAATRCDDLDADWLGLADAQAVCDVLVAEPDALIARVLRMNAWHWKAKVLACLETERRLRVNELLLDPANRYHYHARLDAALLQQLKRLIQHRALMLSAQPVDIHAVGSPAAGRSLHRGLLGLWRRRRSGSTA